MGTGRDSTDFGKFGKFGNFGKKVDNSGMEKLVSSGAAKKLLVVCPPRLSLFSNIWTEYQNTHRSTKKTTPNVRKPVIKRRARTMQI